MELVSTGDATWTTANPSPAQTCSIDVEGSLIGAGVPLAGSIVESDQLPCRVEGESLRTFFAQSFMLSPDARVTERFTRVADDKIVYRFEVDDPKMFAQVWKAEMAFNTSKGTLYEYACHEGNYALPGILAGARKNDSLGLKNYAEEGE
jgi:hypothetical protein